MVPGSEAAPLLSDTAHGERTDQIRHFLDEGDGGEGLQETLRHNVPGRPACPRRPAAHRRTDVAAPSLAGGGQKGAPRRETPPLHEAVACHHEKAPSRRHRLQWMGEHLQDRIPLGTLFTMRNPVKESPLVELTVQLHERLARGEITVDEVNRQVSAYATSHAEELSQRGSAT